jgi:tricorn protease-like protein
LWCFSPQFVPACFLRSRLTHCYSVPHSTASFIAFSYAGDLWTVSRDGGQATRLTTGTGIETDPVFSPDGTMIAFTGEYDGNTDVFVVPASGGIPRRLTYHPAADYAVGWTPDGKSVIFRSNRVDMDPKSVSEGHDPQLEKAVSLALDELAKHPVPEPHKPAYPDYNRSGAQ